MSYRQHCSTPESHTQRSNCCGYMTRTDRTKTKQKLPAGNPFLYGFNLEKRQGAMDVHQQGAHHSRLWSRAPGAGSTRGG